MCQPRHRGRGELAEWLRSGLQIRVQEFDSPTRLHYKSKAYENPYTTIIGLPHALPHISVLFSFCLSVFVDLVTEKVNKDGCTYRSRHPPP